MPNFQYIRIAAALRERVARADFPQSRIPSERTLMAEFGVQRDTVRQALRILETEGLIRRDRTRGRIAVSVGTTPTRAETILLAVRRSEFSASTTATQQGMMSPINDAGYGVLWFDTLGRTGKDLVDLPTPAALRAQGIVGVALWPELPAALPPLRALRAAMPLVILDRRIPGFEADFVGFDDIGAGRTITEHLLRQGHRRIGFVSAESRAATVQARVQGWSDALASAGLRAESDWVLHQEQGIRTLPPERLLAYLDGEGSPLTAIVCANDTVAAQMIYFLHCHKQHMPHDVTITGFGNVDPSLLDPLNLTTMAQPFGEMGRVAARMLLARLQDPGRDVQDVELGMELVVR